MEANQSGTLIWLKQYNITNTVMNVKQKVLVVFSMA